MPKNCYILRGKWCSKHHKALFVCCTRFLDQIYDTTIDSLDPFRPNGSPNLPICSETSFMSFGLPYSKCWFHCWFQAGSHHKQLGFNDNSLFFWIFQLLLINYLCPVGMISFDRSLPRRRQGSWLGVAPQRAWAPRPSTVDAAGPCWKESRSTMAPFSPIWHGTVVLLWEKNPKLLVGLSFTFTGNSHESSSSLSSSSAPSSSVAAW